MIYLIAGEDEINSRKKLTDLLVGKKNIIRLDGKKAQLSTVLDAFVAKDLFSVERNVVVENFSKIKPQKEFYEKILETESDKTLNLFLWEGDTLDTKTKNALKAIKQFNYSFPKFYFAFLDSFSPNSKESVHLLHEVLKTLEAEQVLYGLIKRVRQLLALKSSNYGSFSEFLKMQSWQLGKLRSQSNLWSEEELKDKFLELIELDEKMRTSGLTMSLADHLDIILSPDL
ncbi:MAG TPA: hypothetical protein VHE53_05775 [Patescibacteria group bacterium]|nr:hypothetical protein [Patescibacteria group bacterium]